ncbi:MAG TPA: tripartite tricarboxylate transporter substrate binding protein [Burkholderiales bacterium]|nr:tripartite tricarboxylate transporter substrate binding protein [Burkholderiales bacterium]
MRLRYGLALAASTGVLLDVVAAGPVVPGAHAAAIDAFPTKPVRVLVPQTPGSSADFFARVVFERLREKWGIPVVVDNRAGAGGAISMELLKQATPDGHTLTLTTEGTLAIIPHLYRNPHYNALTDFAPITRVASAPYVLIANPALPAKSVKELIALAKSKPGQINFASGGNGTGTHLSGELFRIMAGIQIVHVPYKGASLGMTDVMTGQVQMMFTGVPTALAQVRAGRLRALAVTTIRRAAVLPDVPTVSESGLAGYEVAPWWGVLVPAGTPRAVIDRLHADVASVLKEDAFRQQLAGQGAEVVGDTPQQFARSLKAEFEKWGKVVKDAGVRVE